MALPEKKKLLEDAWEVLKNIDTHAQNQQVVNTEIFWAKTVIELANALPALPTGDRPFHQVVGS